jgi:ATP-dependent exoDNAse (exonuclease V) alpha subunit
MSDKTKGPYRTAAKPTDRLHELADILIAKSKERQRLHAAIFTQKAELKANEEAYRKIQAERVALQDEFRALAPKTYAEAAIAFPEPDSTIASLLPPKPREPKR